MARAAGRKSARAASGPIAPGGNGKPEPAAEPTRARPAIRASRCATGGGATDQVGLEGAGGPSFKPQAGRMGESKRGTSTHPAHEEMKMNEFDALLLQSDILFFGGLLILALIAFLAVAIAEARYYRKAFLAECEVSITLRRYLTPPPSNIIPFGKKRVGTNTERTRLGDIR